MKNVGNMEFSAFHLENEEQIMSTVAGRRVSRFPCFSIMWGGMGWGWVGVGLLMSNCTYKLI
jgi:hypothetical protein